MRKKTKSILSQEQAIKNDLKCQYCGKEFKYESEKKRHEQSHSPQFTCKVCNKKFSFVSALRRHEKQHERTGSVCCPHCNRKFRDESLMKRHIKYAHKGTFTCIKCNGTFNSDLALHSHMKIHKPVSERKYRCSFEGCNKTFNFPHHLKHHELTHTNTKQYFCSICDKGFIQYHHMKSHLKTHKPNSLLPCPFPGCGKSFSSASALRKHSSVHKNMDSDCAIVTDTVINYKIDSDENTCTDTKSLSDTDFTESGTLLNENSSQSDWREQYLDLEKKYSVNSFDGIPNTLCQSEDEELPIIQKVNSLEINEEAPISNCKSSLGGCIMGEDANHKCLCAQIQPNAMSIEDTYELLTNTNKCCNSVTKSEVNSNQFKPVKINNNCDTCSCMNEQVFNEMTVTLKNIDSKQNDLIDYRSDGTIKIKDTTDIDTNSVMLAHSIDRIMNLRNASDNIPFNSCKAVLGTCIVSGDGTIDEGCLCAKMAMDDQQMLDQEITELTPCPKN